MLHQTTPESLGIAPGALNSAAKLRPILVAAREAFQRGLGDAGSCVSACLVFDDIGRVPHLAFQVRSADGAFLTTSELMATLREQSMAHIEERGAACATSIRCSLFG